MSGLPVLLTEYAVGSKPSNANPVTTDITALEHMCYTKATKPTGEEC